MKGKVIAFLLFGPAVIAGIQMAYLNGEIGIPSIICFIVAAFLATYIMFGKE